MASNASRTLRSKRTSKISKSYAGSVLAKSKYKPQRNKNIKKSRGKNGKEKLN